MNFVKTISDLAARPQNIGPLEEAGVLRLLGPLINDANQIIQQTAVTAVGKIANYDEQRAQAVVEMNFIPQLLKNIEKQNVRIRM